MTNFNILRNATVRNAMSCRHDTNDGYSVVWDENENFKQYGEYSGLTTRLVWDRNYFAVATSGVAYIGPTTDQPPVDAGVYNLVKATFRIEVGLNQQSPATGKIQFQTSDDPIYDETKVAEFTVRPDNAYNEYTIDMSLVKEWQGEITRVRLYPFIDGQPGNIVHFKSIRLQSSNNFACDTIHNTPICSKYTQYAHPCPWVGAGGSCQGSATNDGIDIVEGVNDRLLVDINGYGNQGVVLTPVRGARLEDIGRDLEDKLSNVGIGGYAGNKVEVEFGRLKIIADDTREADSTAVVRDTPAARTLGFYDSEGNSTYDSEAGVEAASRYEPAGTRQLSRGELAHFYLPDVDSNETGVLFDPRRYVVQAGRADFAEAQKTQKIDGFDQTLIDFNNPITNNGIITSFSYAGDATTETRFIFFRPSADGTLTQLESIQLPSTAGSLVDRVFEVSTEVRVRKGDLVGLYDVRVDAGRSDVSPNVSYFVYEGLLEDGDTVGPLPVQGRGEAGLRLFARGQDTETEAVVEFSFDEPVLVEEVAVVALEEAREEEINLTRSKGGGVNGGPFVSGETGVDKFGDVSPGLTNLEAVTDGIRYNRPGAPTLYPSWLDTTVEPPDRYDQTEFSVTLDFAKGIPVFFDINRLVMYFRDANNVKYYSIEYPITTNDADTLRNWGSVTGTYDDVYLDGRLLEPRDHPIYTNPIHIDVQNYEHGYQLLEYFTADYRFQSVRARSLRYRVRNFFYEADETKGTYSPYTLAPSPHILEIEAYARSLPTASISDNFFFESSLDGDAFVLHQTIRDDGATSARYLIGYPVRHLRVRVRPRGRLEAKSFSVSTSRAATAVGTNLGDQELSLSNASNDFTNAEVITVTNDGDEAFNYFVSISPQRNPVERCILWNKLGSSAELVESEIGPAPSVSKRDSYFPREYNYAYNAPAYMADPYRLLNNNTVAYVSYDHGSTWEQRGNMVTDYTTSTMITSVSPLEGDYDFVYIVIDLGAVYSLETIQKITPSGFESFSGPLYTGKDVSNPVDLNIIDDFIGSQEGARWLRYVAPARAAGDPTIAALGYIRVSLDPLARRNKGKVNWVEAPLLTNFVFGNSFGNPCGEGWHCSQSGYTHYYAVDLEDSYRITNLIAGPNSNDGLSLTSDVDRLSPGGAGSRYTANSTSNSNITYSNSNTSDISRVVWGRFGDAPGDKSRWILLKSNGGMYDEVAVHIEDNDNSKKPAFGSERWWTAQLGGVRKDRVNFQEGLHSIAIDYAANQGPAEEEIELVTSFGIDHDLAKRDQLRLWVYVSDVTQLDFTKGHIALGRNETEDNDGGGGSPLSGVTPDRTNYYQWPLSDLETIITTGWSEVFLPFTDNYRVGQPNFTRDNYLALSATAISGRSRIRWFRMRFAGVGGNEALTINLNGLEIVRADFVPAKFGNGLYLAGDEYARFPLTNFNTLRGAIEFYLNADWTKSPGCNSCDDPRDHTIFRFFNSDGYVLAGFMTGEGLRIYFTDGEKQYYLTDNNSVRSILVGVNTHFAVTWDFLGQNSNDAIRVYIDNELSSSFKVSNIISTSFVPNPNTVLMLGGLGWDGVIIPMATSVEGVVDNLRVYNYPKTDFEHSLGNVSLEHIRPSDDLIEISVDGATYYGTEDRGHGLPVLVRNVQPGEQFTVHVRNKQQEGAVARQGQSRTSFVEILKARAG